jgi:myo-inositol 2-dehydrogenase/D-chiro-inositol 1-dehydrogenase
MTEDGSGDGDRTSGNPDDHGEGSPARVLRAGVIGTGIMGADHVRRLAGSVSGAEVVAVSDADRDRAARVACDAGGCRVHDEGLGLIKDPGVDVVVVASPDPTHERFVLACVEAGKPVLCEKPLAETSAACQRIISAEVAAGRRLVQVGFMRRFDPGYAEMKRLLDSSALGAPLLVHNQHRNEQSPPWFASGMSIVSSAIHEIDTLRWLLGEEIVAAQVMRPRRSGAAPGGLEDPLLILLRTAGGVLADAEVFVNAGYGYDVRCELVGETGTTSLVPPAPVATRAARAEGQRLPSDWIERFAAAYDRELQAWVDATARGTVAGAAASAWDGYAATAVAEACLESLAGGGTVEVSLATRPPLYA